MWDQTDKEGLASLYNTVGFTYAESTSIRFSNLLLSGSYKIRYQIIQQL